MNLFKIMESKVPLSFFLSLVFHIGITLLTFYLLSFQKHNKPVSGSVFLMVQKQENNSPKVISENFKNIEEEKELLGEQITGSFLNFEKTDLDTDKVTQIYRENTLNVSIRYPAGWTYIDQNLKDKLDGVTFWAEHVNSETPPFIHLEVQDKYIFNPSYYNHKFEYKGNEYFYNEPEEMEEYFTQIIYIRTKSDEDFSIKLMVKSSSVFKSLQREFFNMVKSFKFGYSLF